MRNRKRITRDLRWMEKVQDNFIEQVLFPDIR